MEVKILEAIVPSRVRWNATEVKEYIDELLEGFGEIVVTPDMSEKEVEKIAKACKSDVAKLRKVKDSINSLLITDAKREILKEFETNHLPEVKGILSRIEGTIQKLTALPDEIERKRKEKKLEEIQELFNSVMFEIAGSVEFSKLFSPKMLNKTYKLQDIEKEFREFKKGYNQAMEIMVKLAPEKRAIALAKYHEDYKLDTALMYAETATEKQAVAVPKPEGVKRESEQTGEEERELVFSVRFRCKASKAKELKEWLINNGISYENI